MKYGFIGIGNMGGAILRGMLDRGALQKEDVLICGRDPDKTARQAADLGVKAAADQTSLVKESDIFLVGVEPKNFPEVMPLVVAGYDPGKTCVSMAAGITIAELTNYLGPDASIIRIMPNTPAKVGEIMTSVSRNGNVSDEVVEDLIRRFSRIGKAEETPEDMIHAVIGVSGSSPAYTYLYIKALADMAAEQGMDPAKARTFAAQAVLGAAKIVLESDASLDALVDAVCTPGGTTYEAVTYLKGHGFGELVSAGAAAACRRSQEMSEKK